MRPAITIRYWWMMKRRSSDGLLLASACRYGLNPCAAPLLRRLLRRARARARSRSCPLLVALFPLLSSLSSLAADLLGATALQSPRHCRAIASDAALLRALLRTLTHPRTLSALLDLSVSSFARRRLREAGALPALLHLLCRPTDTSSPFFASLLRLSLLLINTSHPLSFPAVPPHLVRKLLPLLASIPPTTLTSPPRHLSQAIFRLSLPLPLPLPPPPSYSQLSHPLLHSWEHSPLLIPKGSPHHPHKAHSILLPSLDPSSPHSIIDSILQYSVTCPPIASDDLDIDRFLNESEASLGSPLLYNQDVRIVKTGPGSHTHDKEHHFPYIHRCKEAFNNGYSIALKGMQFRSHQIASLSLAFSQLFGLPSIGANLYLTPPAAQGLARHYDDHCVLVWQIIGTKTWTILRKPKSIMPRLYECLDNTFANEQAGQLEILLQEGDILYVPRGYFHEARTSANATGAHRSDCSLHLTFAIEVERPFEWEGFMHVALHCWRKKLNQTSDNIVLNSNSRLQNITHTLLLHFAIKLISDQTPIFWKACMVASNFTDKYESTFDRLINIINEQSNFMEAFNWVKLAVERREEDSIQCLRWLRNVDDDIEFDNLLETLEKYVVAAYRGKAEAAMSEFSLFKSRFCEGAVYEDACASFCSLLEKYRKARRQYMKGMLSLHREY